MMKSFPGSQQQQQQQRRRRQRRPTVTMETRATKQLYEKIGNVNEAEQVLM